MCKNAYLVDAIQHKSVFGGNLIGQAELQAMLEKKMNSAQRKAMVNPIIARRAMKGSLLTHERDHMQIQRCRTMTLQYKLSVLCLCWLFLSGAVTAQNWPQWGGPQRTVMVDAKGLAETWPANGPKRLWSRELGEGHSSVVGEGGRLYTMYSKGEEEFVVALDATTGKTIWEKGNAAPTTGLGLENGKGPHSTPLLAGDLLFTVGVIGKLQAFEQQTGKIVWSHDLYKEYRGTRMGRGYSCSPAGLQEHGHRHRRRRGPVVDGIRPEDGHGRLEESGF
jgi:hypothetical protein